MKQLLKNIAFFISVITFSTCSLLEDHRLSIRSGYYFKHVPPPGTVKIDVNLFYDAAETSNLSYVEYLYWTKKVYGQKSHEYTAALPDQYVWIDTLDCLSPHTSYYLGHPAYRYYPVVGVTQAQAKEFAAWRSDRVLQFLLIKAKKITYDPLPDSVNFFSIEKYFAGKYQNQFPDTSMLYAVYRLPTLAEYHLALGYNLKNNPSMTEKIFCDNKPCKKGDTTLIDATTSTYWPDKKQKSNTIYNTRGNVREWILPTNISVGGAWSDTRERILLYDTFNIPKNNFATRKDSVVIKNWNAQTGFRLVAEWKKWDMKTKQ